MMSEQIHGTVLSFLLGEFARKEGRQCVGVELVSSQQGGTGVPIRRWDRKDEPALFESQGLVEQLTSLILREAQDYADSFGTGQHRFVVVTEQHLGARPRKPFRLVAASDGEEPEGNDAPNSQGMVAQQMRHNEIHMRMNASMYQTTLGVMQRQILDLAEENARLRRERSDHLSQLEASRSQQDERDMAMTIQLSADKRKDMAVEKLLQFAPVLASRVLGGDTVPGAQSPLSMLINGLADSLTPEQVQRLAAGLNVQQQVMLAEAIKTARASKPPESPDPDGEPTNGHARPAPSAT